MKIHPSKVAWCYELEVFDRQVWFLSRHSCQGDGPVRHELLVQRFANETLLKVGDKNPSAQNTKAKQRWNFNVHCKLSIKSLGYHVKTLWCLALKSSNSPRSGFDRLGAGAFRSCYGPPKGSWVVWSLESENSPKMGFEFGLTLKLIFLDFLLTSVFCMMCGQWWARSRIWGLQVFFLHKVGRKWATAWG